MLGIPDSSTPRRHLISLLLPPPLSLLLLSILGGTLMMGALVSAAWELLLHEQFVRRRETCWGVGG